MARNLAREIGRETEREERERETYTAPVEIDGGIHFGDLVGGEEISGAVSVVISCETRSRSS
jgi:hypothetical protein